ncbi:MAG TPA: FG-GAP repeat protein [Steroidobacteraceae bacterium]|nr:FG-GAP repeat protein [Steroidobacteraceae bacterium]
MRRAHLSWSSLVRACLLLLVTSPLLAQGAPPDKPQVTVGANLKELLFDWEPVPGAVLYRLLVKTSDNPRVYYQPLGERIRRTSVAIPIAVHQQRWLTTRYIVMACNPAGCTRSDEIYPRDLMLDSIGYFKASNTDAGDHFGSQVAMSADGGTLAVSAEGEASGSSGVNAGEYDDSAPNSGAVYVFRRTGRSWAQEIYIKPPETEAGARFGGGSPVNGHTLALSADGNTMLVGAPSATVNNSVHAGEVHLYKRDALGRWGWIYAFSAVTSVPQDYFGYDVDISSDGLTYRIGSMLPQLADGRKLGRTHIVTYDGVRWNRTLIPQYSGTICRSSRMSGDGFTVMQYCQDTLEGGTFVRTWTRQTNGTWLSNSADLIAPATDAVPKMAINYAGTWLAVDEGDNGVGMYRRDRRDRNWTLDTHILSPGMSPGGPYNSWATALEFDRHGDYLAIGDPQGFASGAGVAAQATCCGPQPGDGFIQIWKHVAENLPQWVFITQVKAPNPGSDDRFAQSIAFGGLGWYLAVGAPNEASSIGGIDGNQDLEDAPGAGAVYLY